ncbi:hypothetical protein AB0I53_18970 [Saccharopolyspora sp. NPDC050389]
MARFGESGRRAAVEHLDSAIRLFYSDAGHAFLFQHTEAFTTAVTDFLAD